MKRTTIAALVTALLLPVSLLADGIERRPPLRDYRPHAQHAKFDSSHSYDAQSYALWISLPMANDSLYGHVRMGALSRQAGLASVALNAASMTVDSVLCDGAAAAYTPSGSTLSVTLPGVAAGGHFTLDVYYRLGGRGTSRIGYYWYPRNYDGSTLHTVAYSMAEPQDGRYWMPCFDEPWDKADSGCAIAVTVPDSFAVASNGTFQDTVRSGNRLTWRWREPYPVSTYLMCFTVSRFALWADTAHTVSGRSVPLNYFMWPEDSATSRTVFATVPGMVRMLDSLFHEYAFDKYGMAAVYPFDYGGMEHQTMTTIHRYWIPQNSQFGILHELSHQWFGDMVTCGTWADIWLNEGFASYCEALYDSWLNHRLPGGYMTGNFSSALSGNADTYPIYDPLPALIFDESMVYSKGAWVLQGLRWTMGDPLFFPMMRAYADSFAYGNAVTADFQRIAERHYGSSLQWYFDQWVHRAGHPKYTTVVYYKTHPDSNAALVTVKQTSITGQLYKMQLALACSTAAGVDSTVVAWDSLAIHQFALSDAGPIRHVMLDPDHWVLKNWIDSVPRIRNIIAGNRQLTVIWNQFAADPAPPSGYNVYRGPAATGPFARVSRAIVADTSYLDTGLVAGTRYYYTVTAVSGADTCFETHFSNAVSRIPNGVEGGRAEHNDNRTVRLEQNQPNPFQQSTMISYQLPAAGQMRLRVYNTAGQLVRTLVNSRQTAGRHAAVWNGADDRGRKVAAGLYYYCLESGGTKLARSLQYIK